MDGSYFDGKEVDTLALPNHCIIRSIHRNRKNLLPQGQTLVPGDQVEIEMDAQDIEKIIRTVGQYGKYLLNLPYEKEIPA